MTDLEAAWDEIHDAKPDGWCVGPTTYEEHRREWTLYAFDSLERVKAGATPTRLAKPSISTSTQRCPG